MEVVTSTVVGLVDEEVVVVGTVIKHKMDKRDEALCITPKENQK